MLAPLRVLMRRKNARNGPGTAAADHAASTSIVRAVALPCLEMRPWMAPRSLDCRTRGVSPEKLASFSGEPKRLMLPMEATTAVAITELIPATVISLRVRASSSEMRISCRSSPARRRSSQSSSSR